MRLLKVGLGVPHQDVSLPGVNGRILREIFVICWEIPCLEAFVLEEVRFGHLAERIPKHEPMVDDDNVQGVHDEGDGTAWNRFPAFFLPTFRYSPSSDLLYLGQFRNGN